MADFGFGYDSSGDSGGGYGGSSLAETIIGAAATLGSQAILANANTANVALIQGQAISSPSLTTSGQPYGASAKISGMGLLVLGLIAVGLYFVAIR